MLLAMALQAAGGVALAPDPTVDLRDAAIRVGDVVRGVPRPIAAVEIARLPAGRSSITLSRRAIVALVSRAAPSIEPGPGGAGSIRFMRARGDASRTRCFAARHALPEGDAIAPWDVRGAPCVRIAPPVRYDPARGTIMAARAIAADDFIGHALPPATPMVARGAALTLVGRVGPVTVERAVVALQHGRRGGRVFVRAGDGRVFAVPIAADRP